MGIKCIFNKYIIFILVIFLLTTITISGAVQNNILIDSDTFRDNFLIDRSTSLKIENYKINTLKLNKNEQQQYLQPIVSEKINNFEIKTFNSKTLNQRGDIVIADHETSNCNPAIVSNEDNCILSMWEWENIHPDYNIVFRNSIDGGSSWNPITNYFNTEGHPTQPRLDFYSDKKAFGTFLEDQNERPGYITHIDFRDIGSLDCSGDYWSSHDNSYEITSSDISSYKMSNPPDPGFWGIIALTGSSQVITNGFFICWTPEEGILNVAQMSDDNYFVYNVSVEIDQSSGWMYMVADGVKKTDPTKNVIVMYSKQITSDPDWHSGNWQGAIFDNDKCFYNPQIDSKDGRIYLVAEWLRTNGKKDLVCWAHTSDSEWWYGTSRDTIQDDEYPVVTAISSSEAKIAYTTDNNLYYTIYDCISETFDNPVLVNDVDDTAVEQYGCADVSNDYVVWTDDRLGYKAVYFDFTINSNPPNKPTIDGPKRGKTGDEYTYYTSTTDDEDQIWYWFDWGDGTNSGWVGPYPSGTIASESHKWSADDTYIIKVKAKDKYDLESKWSDGLNVTMPRNNQYNTILFHRFLQGHPYLFLILQYLL